MKTTRRTLIATAAACAVIPNIAAAQRKPQDKEVVSSAGHKLNFSKFEKMAGFDTGNKDAKRKVFVFFDAQCPHCAALWNAHKPLQQHALFRWIPVGVLNRASVMQGSTILGAKDPAVAMDEHETLMQKRRGGITANPEAADKFSDKIKEQTKALQDVGARSVPFMAYLNEKGEGVSAMGSMQTPILAAFLGLASVAAPTTAPVKP